ncbi:MAG: PAS domain S-box protein [Chitinophagales bacterium]|nr:PAS domain S-box protein [Chitinophagales bacterium]
MKKKYLKSLPPLILVLAMFIVAVIYLMIRLNGKERRASLFANSGLQYVSQINNLENAAHFHRESLGEYARAKDTGSLTLTDSSLTNIIKVFDSLKNTLKTEEELKPLLDSLTYYVNKRVTLSSEIISLGLTSKNGEQILDRSRTYGYFSKIFNYNGKLQSEIMQMLKRRIVANAQDILHLRYILMASVLFSIFFIFLIIRNFMLNYSLSRRLENQLKDYNIQLQKKVDERTNEFRKSEERFRTLVEQASDAIVITNKEGELLEVNDSSCTMTGYSKEELLKMNIREIVIQETEHQMQDAVERLKHGERLLNERRIKKNDGALLAIESTSRMLTDGRIISINRDITERKTAEEALRTSEFNNRMVVENRIMGVSWASPEGRLINVNKTLCDMMGFSREELIGQHFSDFSHPDDLTVEMELLDGIIRGETSNYVFEKRYRKKNGDYFWVEVNLTGYHDQATGKISFFIALVHDIQLQRQTEDALKESEKKLRQVLSSYGDMFYVLDKQGTIILINELAKKSLSTFWGKPVDLGGNITDLTPESNKDILQERLQKVLKGETLEYEALVNVPGHLAWYLVSMFPVKDDEGNIYGVYVYTRDITEKKAADEKLQQSVNRFEMISLAVNDALWEWDLETGELWANETHQRLYGLTVNDPVPTEDLWLEFIHPDERAKMKESQINSLKSDKNIFTSEYRFKPYSSPEYRYIFDRTFILRNEKGEPLKKMGSMVDITERKRAEKELIEAEAKFRNLVEASLVGVYIIQDGMLAYLNPRLAEMMGYTVSEMMDNFPIRKMVHPDYWNLVEENIRLRLEGYVKSTHYEVEFIKKDGTVIPVEAFGSRTDYMGKPAIIGSVLDITDRKKAEKEIRIAKELSDQIIESLPGVFYLYNQKGVMLRWNKHLEEISGYSHDEIAKMSPVQFFGEDEMEYIKESIQKIFAEGDIVIESHIVTKDKKRIPFYFNGVKIFYESEFCVLGFGVDISEQKKAAEKLEDSYDAIRRLSKHLQNIREEERTNIAREIHDELGQQLTVLKMDVSWLSKKLGDKDEIVKQKLDDLLNLIDTTVKTIRRISSELRPSLLDDMGLVPAMEWYLKEFEKRASVKTNFKTTSEDLNLPNPIRTGLFRIFQESLTNVARHAKAHKVDVAIQSDNGNIQLSIKDDGEGFEIERARIKKTLGILGMEERTFMMGGKYEVKSKPGKGTKIVVSVPCSWEN